VVAEARAGGTGHRDILKYVQQRFGLTYGYANYVALRAREMASGAGGVAGDDPVAAQYAGSKAALRPIYDAVVAAVKGFGADVELAPKKGYVSLRRHKQFGCVEPATSARVDVGLILSDAPTSGRLKDSANSMFTHLVHVGSVAEVDEELVGLLRRAYEAA
jgi:predicted transport protein